MAALIPAWLDRWIAGELPLTELGAGRIVLPSGQVIACDPLVSLESARPFTRAVPEGRHPVTLGLLEGEVALAYVRFGRAKVARWEIALCAGESAGENDEERPGYSVDSGTGCFVDAQAAAAHVAEERARYQRVTQRLRDEGVDPDDPLAWHEAFETKLAEDGPDPLGSLSASIQKKRFASVALDAESGGTLVACSTGVGDGVYASYWGLDAKGRPMMLVTDFGLVERPEDRGEDEVREDEDEMDEDDDMDLDELEEWLERRVPAAEAPPAASPLLPRAEQLLKRWESSGKLQLEDDCDRRALAEALLEKLVTLEGHRHLGGHLAEWLMERSEVADVFASDDELEADLRAP